ncbi:MAG: GNAT family N-acetyltransferase [Candidatus Hodarchaeota archaeon]
MLIGKYVILRGLELTDVDELMKYWNREEVKEFLTVFSPHSKEEEIEWIRKTWERRNNGEAYIFGIIDSEKDLYIGNIELRVISQILRRGTIGLVIFNPEYWNKGFGTEALKLIINYGFKNINLYSIELEVIEPNLRAQACYRKVGFKEVGRRRKAQFYKGTYVDSIMMDIISSEWLET